MLGNRVKTVDDRRGANMRKQIAVFGTEENGFSDSGLWRFLRYVKTKDEHDEKKPVKSLMVKDGHGGTIVPPHLEALFLYLLWSRTSGRPLAVPKSRQMQISWGLAIYAAWFARTAPHRLIIIQSKKEQDAFRIVSLGDKSPLGGRISFIENNLPAWLGCWRIRSGEGNKVGHLTYYNNSEILALPEGADQIRSMAPSLYINDESAFQPLFSDAYSAALPAAQQIVMVSSAWPGHFCDLVNKPFEEEVQNGDSDAA